MRAVLNFLFESDYPPWPLQVFWKALLWFQTSVFVYLGHTEGWGFYMAAAACFLLGTFTKLGEQ